MKLLFIILSVLTTYNRGVYVTTADVDVNVPAEQVAPLVDRMAYEFQTNPDLLFEWAFKGTGQQHDADKDAVVLALTSLDYDAEKKHSTMTFNIDVNGKPKFKNVVVMSQVTDSLEADTMLTRLDINYVGHLFKTIFLNFRVKPVTNNTCKLVMDTHLQFGWFFNIFITRKVYRQTVEWRVERFMLNVKEMAETGEVKDHDNNELFIEQ